MRNRVRVKICGITSLSDALAAITAGADALGFMFFDRSARHLPVEKAARLVEDLPPFISKTGVFVDASAGDVQNALLECGLDTLQFHGAETPEYCSGFSKSVIKAFRVENDSILTKLPSFQTSAWLLDSFVPGHLGGTGAVFNWKLAEAAGKLGTPIILAGGLTPENVAEAIRVARPFAVDVSSGVESSPGKKDPEKMRRFIDAVQSSTS